MTPLSLRGHDVNLVEFLDAPSVSLLISSNPTLPTFTFGEKLQP